MHTLSKVKIKINIAFLPLPVCLCGWGELRFALKTALALDKAHEEK